LPNNARKFNPNVKVLPIGLKVSDYQPDCPAKSDNKIRLVWIGSKGTLKYLAEIKPALEEIGSSFDSTVLRIVGDDFFDLRNMPVEKRLWSKDTRGIDLATSDIGLAPLPENRFTKGKCSFKVLEYASAGLPVIASPIGTNAEYVLPDVTGFFATNMQEWIDKICLLLSNACLKKQMGQKARAYAQNFDISVIGEKLVKIVKDCLGSKELSHV
jgi:hypothetical protein